ncbi:MAG: type III pantothenate kinase [Bryobacterales bacterium]|jgi:type III pantothenate kinase|nr:type III pantothenate kinase [Bryobacterales bacterium]
MLLALDVGNTNITVGVYEDAVLRTRWRLRTVRDQTSDEWGILLRNLFDLAQIHQAQVDGLIIASVVPPLDTSLARMGRRYFHLDPVFVTSETDTGITIRYDNPREVGADRIVNAVAAFHKYGGPVVVVDLGTAITFDVVSANGEYLGGVICPGIGVSVEALVARTARLPQVDFRNPGGIIGKTTVTSMQAGLYYGAIGMIDSIAERLQAELGPHVKTIATGGQASMIVADSRYLKHVDEDITLEGLRLIWERVGKTV